MKFKDCFQSSEHLEIKTSRSFSLFKSVFFFQKTNQFAFLEKALLHSYGRNASNVYSQIGDEANLTKEEGHGWNSRNLFGSIPGLLIMIPLWCN